MALPRMTGWDVHVRYFPPLHAEWDPRIGTGHAALAAGRRAGGVVLGRPGRAASVARAAALDVRRGRGVAVQPRPRRRRQEGDRHDPRRRVRVPPHRASDDGPPRDAEGVRLADPVRRPPGQHRARQLAGARRRPPARRAELLRPARPHRARRRPAGGHRGHPARRHDRGRRTRHPATARRRGGRPPRRPVPGLRARRDLAGGERRRDVRGRRRVGHRRPRRRCRTTQRASGPSSPGCCSGTP